jgi:voltage-gated sodium channel
MVVASALNPVDPLEDAAAWPGGPEGRQADFSDLQLAQLRSAVRDAIREEIRAGQFQSGCWTPPWAAEAMCSADVRVGSKRKAPDEPVVVGLDDMDGDVVGTEYRESTVRSSAISECRVSATERVQSGHRARGSANLMTQATVDINTLYTNNTGLVQKLRRLAYSIEHNLCFDIAIGLMILLNQVFIGMEAQYRIDNVDASWIFWVESAFLVVFIVEALIRLAAHGRSNFSSSWFWLDIFLVGTGVVFTWILEPMKRIVDIDEIPLANQVLILRTLRVIRMVRAFRLMQQVRELWQLCGGLLRSARTMAAVSILLVVAIFMFSCLGIDLITYSDKLKANEETRAIVANHFQSLPTFMLTLVQFANADSIASIYFPLCRQEPLLILYFASVWLVVTIVMMNLVTAIIVENALSKGREDEHDRASELRQTVKRIIPDIMAVFDKIDTDGSGSVTMAEVAAVANSGELILPSSIHKYVEPDRLLDLLTSFDMDGSGEIDRQEFVDGVVWLVISDVPMETHHILVLLKQCNELLLQMSTNSVLAPPGNGNVPAAS